MKSQRGFVDSCEVQRAWREEIKNVLIWSTGLNKEQQGRCVSSEPEKDKERKQDSQSAARGHQQRCSGRFNQKSRESPRKGSASLAWTTEWGDQRTQEGRNLKEGSSY